jgi:uncharacterized protein YneF (UPF0154 family)
MDICLTVLVGLLGICIGSLIGLWISSKINHDYILGMNDTSEKFTKNLLDIMVNYFDNMIKHEENYFINTMTDLAKAVDDINKVYEKPIWRKTEEELPPCSGLYYGKIKGNPHGENAMWKVVYNDNEWSLSGYPDNKVEISEWTEIY